MELKVNDKCVDLNRSGVDYLEIFDDRGRVIGDVESLELCDVNGKIMFRVKVKSVHEVSSVAPNSLGPGEGGIEITPHASNAFTFKRKKG